ncbi:MAG: flagellar protein FliO/FliZ [Clostridia bacterium]|nr:flagellar protein FliO/FliZ [Clostridia bacterium]
MDQDLTLALIRLIIFLPVVLVLAYVTVRFGLGRASSTVMGAGHLQVIDRISLTNKTAVAVIRCGTRYFLISFGDGSPKLLAELPDFPTYVSESKEVDIYSLKSLEKSEKENKDYGAIKNMTMQVKDLLQGIKQNGN